MKKLSSIMAKNCLVSDAEFTKIGSMMVDRAIKKGDVEMLALITEISKIWDEKKKNDYGVYKEIVEIENNLNIKETKDLFEELGII